MMEQNNNPNNNKNNENQPKMPRFNMNWIYILCLVGLVALFLSGGGDMLGGNAAKETGYTEFKEYVEKGYVLSVVVNTTESKMKLYINPKTSATYTRPAPSRRGPTPT